MKHLCYLMILVVMSTGCSNKPNGTTPAIAISQLDSSLPPCSMSNTGLGSEEYYKAMNTLMFQNVPGDSNFPLPATANVSNYVSSNGVLPNLLQTTDQCVFMGPCSGMPALASYSQYCLPYNSTITANYTAPSASSPTCSLTFCQTNAGYACTPYTGSLVCSGNLQGSCTSCPNPPPPPPTCANNCDEQRQSAIPLCGNQDQTCF